VKVDGQQPHELLLRDSRDHDWLKLDRDGFWLNGAHDHLSLLAVTVTGIASVIPQNQC